MQNIRTKLTAGNIVVFGGILMLYAAGTAGLFLSMLNEQLDASLKEDLELVDQLVLFAPGNEPWKETHLSEASRLERYLEIWTDDGRPVYRSRTLGDRIVGAVPDASERARGIHSRVISDGKRVRVASALHTASAPYKIVRLSVDEEAYYAYIREFIIVLVASVPLGLLLVALGASQMVKGALRPVDAMASAAQRISAQHLNERIPVKNPRDELGRLALAFNELLGRVQRDLDQLKRFTADASHELRTPLSAIRSVGEVGLQRGRTSEEYRDIIGSMLEESNRLTHLVDGLLLLSRAESGKVDLSREHIDALASAQDAVNLVAVLAEEKKQHLEVDGQPGIALCVDRTLLSHALLNVIDNAIKFSPEGSTITARVYRESARVLIDVSDSGPGIPAAEQERVFERFYRLPQGTGGGTGLGLAIARWAVEANDGTLTVLSGKGSGSTFRISLPPSDRTV